MSTARYSGFGDPLTFDPAMVLLIGIILVAAMAVLAAIIVVGLIDRRGTRIDPHAAAHGDVPGFTREQLEQFQATRREPRVAGEGHRR